MSAQRGAGRVGAGGAVDPAARMGGRGGEVEAVHGRLGTAGAGGGAEEQLLVQGRGAAVEGAAVQVAVE